jgi:hypothetical protein
MTFRYSDHASKELRRRAIPREHADSVLESPQQIVPDNTGNKVYQSKIDFGGGEIYLLRLFVNDKVDPAVVITVYRTSKIEKYWRQNEN